jgi:Fe-S cluster assembly ATP-binding protein
MSTNQLKIKNLHVNIIGEEIKPIIKGIDLTIKEGEVHVLMGLNGSGKTTLAKSLLGYPKFSVVKGEILLNGEDISHSTVDERARKGLFLSFQSPEAIEGVSTTRFLQAAMEARSNGSGEVIDPLQLRLNLNIELEKLEMDPIFLSRDLNVGFSGGEQKRSEVLQFLTLKPKFAILDEIDTGLDVDALRIISKGIVEAQKEMGLGILIITHYQRILEYIKPDYVHILGDGKIIKSGGAELVDIIEKEGYGWLKKEGSKA